MQAHLKFYTRELALVLNFAICGNDISLIENILQNGGTALINLDYNVYKLRTHNQYTPILKAAALNQWPSMLYLLEKGAVSNQVNDDGWSALHFTVRDGDINSISALLNSGCKSIINTKTKEGCTPLMLAFHRTAEIGISIMNLLLDNGATFDESYSQFVANYIFAFYKFQALTTSSDITCVVNIEHETNTLFQGLIDNFGTVKGSKIVRKILSGTFDSLSSLEFKESRNLIKALAERKILSTGYLVYNDLYKSYFVLLLLRLLQNHYSMVSNTSKEASAELSWLPEWVQNYTINLKKEHTFKRKKDYSHAKTASRIFIVKVVIMAARNIS